MMEFLRQLRFQLKSEYSLDFDLFDIAYSIYKKKIQPDAPLLDEAYSLVKKGSNFDIKHLTIKPPSQHRSMSL